MGNLIPDCRLDALPMARYRFHLAAGTPIDLPGYKGATLHGGFGHALKTVSPHYYEALFGSGRENGSFPKPFVLVPPLDRGRSYAPGRRFALELTLFGSAMEIFPVCRAALEYLGLQMGFGNNRGKFRILTVDREEPAPADLAAPDPAGPLSGKIHIRTMTRLRLKGDDRLLRHPLPFDLFFARLLGRLNSLAIRYGFGRILPAEAKKALLKQAGSIEISAHDMAWHDWTRYSGRQKTRMKFGGLTGAITYTGDLAPFIPFLALGQWTHVGGKTSFGLGKYAIEPSI